MDLRYLQMENYANIEKKSEVVFFLFLELIFEVSWIVDHGF